MKHVLCTLFIVLPLWGMEKEPSISHVHDLYRAIQKDQLDVIRELLAQDKGLANISFSAICESEREYTGEHETPLMYAIKENRKPIFNLLLKAKADINKAAQNGLTPLLCALLNQRQELSKKLIRKGADTHAKIHIYQGTYMDALALAKNMGFTDIQNQILKKRREFNRPQNPGITTQPGLTPAN